MHKLTKPICKLCGHKSDFTDVYPDLGIVKCPQCSLIFYAGEVNPHELYDESYFSGGEYRDYASEKKIHQWNFDRKLKWLGDEKSNGRLFEIGSAYGFFLDRAKEKYDVKGIEISKSGVEFASKKLGLNVLQGDFLDLPDEKSSYDVVCLWDTIEHLQEPFEYLKKASQWLKPGGVLALTTADIGSLVARVRGKRWRQIHPPTHLFYFSKNTLAEAFKRAGLEDPQFHYEGMTRSYKTTMYSILSLRMKMDPLYKLATFNEKLDLPIYLNLWDLMFVTARKPIAQH